MNRKSLSTFAIAIAAAVWANPPHDPRLYRTYQYVDKTTGRHDFYALYRAKSTAKRPILIVYLHGLGQSWLEPFKYPLKGTIFDAIHKDFPDVSLVSSDYGGPTYFGAKGGFDLITGTIRQVTATMPPCDLIIAGSSMGACSALTYAAIAPTDIRKNITGVLLFYPSDDLTRLYCETKAFQVRAGLQRAFDGTPQSKKDLYRQGSFCSHIPDFPKNAIVSVVVALDDTTMPTPQQQHVVQDLQGLKVNLSKIEVHGNHLPVKTPTIRAAVRYIMSAIQS